MQYTNHSRHIPAKKKNGTEKKKQKADLVDVVRRQPRVDGVVERLDQRLVREVVHHHVCPLRQGSNDLDDAADHPQRLRNDLFSKRWVREGGEARAQVGGSGLIDKIAYGTPPAARDPLLRIVACFAVVLGFPVFQMSFKPLFCDLTTAVENGRAVDALLLTVPHNRAGYQRLRVCIAL